LHCGVWRFILWERREKGELFKREKRVSPNLSTLLWLFNRVKA